MTLKELSAQYEASAQLIRDRLRELRSQMAKTDDPQEKWRLKRRIADLTPMLTQMNDLAWMLKNYYERGDADRDDRYGFTGKRKAKKNERKATEGIAPNIAKRINRFATADLLGLSLSDENHSADRRRAGGVQIHRSPHLETGGTENWTDYAIPLGDALLDQFFTKK